MKLKFSRAVGRGDRPPKAKRAGRTASAPALHAQRETRFYSLLLPPTGNSTRR